MKMELEAKGLQIAIAILVLLVIGQIDQGGFHGKPQNSISVESWEKKSGGKPK